MRLITLHAAVLAALGCVPVAGQSTADTRPRPNVVTIVADDTFVLFTSDNSGRSGDDAKPYQEKQVRKALEMIDEED